MQRIKNVEIMPGCISCGTCEEICSAVFEVRDVSHIKHNVTFNNYSNAIEKAAMMCPVSVIRVEKEK